MRRKVDFPQSDGPMIETNSPSLMLRSMGSSAATRADFVTNSLATPSTTITPGLLSLQPPCAPKVYNADCGRDSSASSTVSTDTLFAGIRLARRAARKRKLIPYEHGML